MQRPLVERFKSRKFLVAMLAQLTGLAVLFAGPEHADAIEAAAQSIGALLLMALTAGGYILGEAKVDAAEAAKKTPALLALILPVMLLGGCVGTQFSDAQVYKMTSNTYADTLDEIVRQSQLGMIDDETMEQVKSISEQLSPVFDQMEAAIVEGRSLDFESAMRSARTLLDRLIAIQLEAERSQTNGTTRSHRGGVGARYGGRSHPGNRTGSAASRARPHVRGTLAGACSA